MWVPGWIKRKLLGRAIKLAVEKLLEGGDVAFLKGIVGSKKLGALILGVLAVVLREVLGLDEAAITAILALVSSYILGQSAVDSFRRAG